METQHHNIERSEKQRIPEPDTQSLTPHELVQHHMEHPDAPITDTDMENLDTGTGNDVGTAPGTTLTKEEKKSADELADAIESDDTDMSYKADV